MRAHPALPVLVALLLRLPQGAARWDEVAWMYAAYPGPTVDALAAGDWAGAMRFVGLHPPFFPLLHAVMEKLAPTPGLWILASVLASTGAVAALAWRWPLAAWVLATAPLQVHHAGELNNYPWLALWVALAWPARELALSGRWVPLAALGVVASWTHGLAGWALGLVACTLGPGLAWRPLLVMALGSLALWPEVFALAREPSTWKQPPFRPELVADDLLQRFGLLGLGLVPIALQGARLAPATLWVFAGSAAFILLLQLLGVAAPHQTPYLLALGAPFAVAVAQGAQSPRARTWVMGVVLAQGGWQMAFEGQRLSRIWADDERAIDLALARSQPGDALILLSPPGVNDDDKRLFSPVLWRLRPWRPMPMARPYPFAYDDFRHGQPRLYEGRVVYVQDSPRAELDLALAASPRAWLVVYEHNNNPRYTQELVQRFGVEPELVGSDLLFVLESPQGPKE